MIIQIRCGENLYKIEVKILNLLGPKDLYLIVSSLIDEIDSLYSLLTFTNKLASSLVKSLNITFLLPIVFAEGGRLI